jgi:hypothetical protein
MFASRSLPSNGSTCHYIYYLNTDIYSRVHTQTQDRGLVLRLSKSGGTDDSVRVVGQKNMVMGPAGPRNKRDCAGEVVPVLN